MKKTISKSIVSLILVLALAISMVPVCFAMDLDDFMYLFDKSVKKPGKKYILDEPVEMVVKSKYGTLVYCLTGPRSDSKKLSEMYEGDSVTVYAVQNGYALAYDNDSYIGGWVSYNLLDDEYYEGPSPMDLEGAKPGFQKPISSDYLRDYQTMYVKSKHGNCIYLLNKPSGTSDKKNRIGTIEEAEEVTVLARHGGYACVIVVSTGEVGWCSANLLKAEYD